MTGVQTCALPIYKDATRTISDISVIEFYSAFAKKVRTGVISREDFQGTVKNLAEDIQSELFKLVSFGDNEKRDRKSVV